MSYKHMCEGSMFVYEGAVATTINATNQYHAIESLGAGSSSHGTTFTAGTNGAITDTDDNGGVLRCIDAGHGLTTGQYVTLNNMGDAAHVGSSVVTVIDVNTFDAEDIAWNSDGDTGSWQMGDSITVDTGHGGTFDVSFAMSFSAAAANKNIKFEMVKNNTDLDEFAAEMKVATGSDLVSSGSSGIAVVEAGDVIWMQVKNTTDSANITIVHANVHINRI